MADQFFGLTDTGRQRSNNEDTFIAQRVVKENAIIASVIDGVGGYSGGEVAAALARESFLNRLNKNPGDAIPTLVDCFNLANERIFKDKQEVAGRNNMACVATLAIIDIDNNQFYYAHVGDTRLYLLRDKSLVKITQDHSFVGYLEDSHRLTEEAAMVHPKRNEINKALGFESDLSSKIDYVETGQSPFLPADILLLCSDGLTDMVNKQDITEILTSGNTLKEKCRLLIEIANENGGRDNITVVLVENDKTPGRHEATMPSFSEKPREMESITSADRHDAIAVSKRPKSVTIFVLTMLMLLFLGSTMWFYLEAQKQVTALNMPKTNLVVKKSRNAQEIKLQQAIARLQGHILILDTSYKSPIVISDAITINKDTLLIKSKVAMVFQGDSAYAGSAFFLGSKTKNLQLDSLTFSNFKTAIISANQTVTLKNVKFINCANAVQTFVRIADKKYVNGRITPAAITTDSLPAKTK